MPFFFVVRFDIIILRDVAQLGSALAWGARGRKFKSCRPDHFKHKAINRFFIFIKRKTARCGYSAVSDT